MSIQQLITKKDIAKESLSLTFGILSTAIGFFLALWVNSLIQEKEEISSFEASKRMILNEARINTSIIKNSYLKFGVEQPGLIFTNLSTSISEKMIMDQKFIGHTNDSLLLGIQQYLRCARLLNNYKDELNTVRKVKYNDPTQTSHMIQWEEPLANSIANKSDTLIYYIEMIKRNIKLAK